MYNKTSKVVVFSQVLGDMESIRRYFKICPVTIERLAALYLQDISFGMTSFLKSSYFLLYLIIQ